LYLTASSSQFDLDIHAGGQIHAHQRVHRLRGGLMDVDETLMRPDLEVLAGIFVLERAADTQ
jgi:hypothetical protein